MTCACTPPMVTEGIPVVGDEPSTTAARGGLPRNGPEAQTIDDHVLAARAPALPRRKLALQTENTALPCPRPVGGEDDRRDVPQAHRPTLVCAEVLPKGVVTITVAWNCPASSQGTRKLICVGET